MSQPETPFVGGYIAAIRASHPEIGNAPFSPETLARIREDCEAHEKAYPLTAHDPRRHSRGFNFWRNRQAGMWTKSGWPPLTLFLGGDGKVYLRDAAESLGHHGPKVGNRG